VSAVFPESTTPRGAPDRREPPAETAGGADAPRPVVREAEYPQPPERVWEALTEPSALSDWLLPAPDFAPQVGRRFRFHTAPDAGSAGDDPVECEVTEAEPPRRLAYTWRTSPDQPAGRVSWTLTPTERGGTRLRVVHEPTLPAVIPARSGPATCSFAVAANPRPGGPGRRCRSFVFTRATRRGDSSTPADRHLTGAR